jgi:bis(5'-nucleosyl)-tetraphosphatase (symmetrical)
MTSEHTPLMASQDDQVYYVEVNEDSIIPTFIRENPMIKYTVVSLMVVLIISLLYVMIILLPSLAPEGIQIPYIPMVKHAKVYLHPILPEKDKGTNPDPDDPVKVIPDFANSNYVQTGNPILKSHLKKLKNEYINLDSKKMKKRIILIGDVHGCLTQLKKFLQYVKYDGGKDDHVLLLGDFMNKGPDSIDLLNFIMKNNINAILGNHELAMLKRYTQFHGLKSPTFLNDDPQMNSTLTLREVYDLDELMKLAKKLTPEHIQFLGNCSPISKIGPVPHYINNKQNKHADYPAEGVAVHAGLLWNKGIYHQNIEEITTIRNLLPPDWVSPTDDRHDTFNGIKSVAWSKIWNEHQLQKYENDLKDVPNDKLTLGTKVYYGHDAKRGVVVKEFSNGLDSGCVYGKQLTGAIIWSQLSTSKGVDKIIYKQMIVDINC